MSDPSESKALLDHVYSAHRKVDHLVSVLDESFRRHPPGGSCTEVRGQLDRLYEALVQHFREEEEGGALEEAVCRCPSEAPHLRALEGQHAELLQALDAFRQRCPPGAAPPEIDVVAAFGEWSATLRAHEESENRLLAQAFGLSWPVDDPADDIRSSV